MQVSIDKFRGLIATSQGINQGSPEYSKPLTGLTEAGLSELPSQKLSLHMRRFELRPSAIRRRSVAVDCTATSKSALPRESATCQHLPILATIAAQQSPVGEVTSVATEVTPVDGNPLTTCGPLR